MKSPHRFGQSVIWTVFFALSLLIAGVICADSPGDTTNAKRTPPPNSVIKEIKSLPGLSATNVTFRQYSGYITVNATSGANLFFWFVESQGNPESDPVMLWLNGGPGCSSLLGLLSENGPFTLQPDGATLQLNPYSWNQAASVIYLESPSGVGFSYSDNGNYLTGDNDTAAGNYNFLLGFFDAFPEYASNPFYIAGESFAGYYVPQTAYAVMKGNSAGNAKINLLGFAVGNPSFDFLIEGNAYLEFMTNHGLVSETEFLAANETCEGSFYPAKNQECGWIVGNLTKNFALINPYNIYQDCGGDGPSSDGGCFTQSFAGATVVDETTNERVIDSRVAQPMSQTFIPCLNYTYMSDYLNQEIVKEAIHVSNSSLPWTACSPYIDYAQFNPSMYPFYDQLIADGSLRIMVYSGDVDSCVPYLGTERCVYGLGLPVESQWRSWIVNDQYGKPQTAGYTVSFSQSVTYVTVKGAGHMVPMYKPQQAYAMISRFLQNQPM